jgi:hypothetical protein
VFVPLVHLVSVFGLLLSAIAVPIVVNGYADSSSNTEALERRLATKHRDADKRSDLR